MLERITKRDGTTVPFEPDKIKGAITKAFISARGSDDEDLIDRLTKAVVRLLKVSLKDKPEDTIINVEEVQDAVETILIKYNLPKVAKEYILFRDCHNKIRKTKDVMINAQTLVGDYIDKLDWRVNENANSGYSYASMLNHISGSVVANYTLSNIYPERIAKAHRDGDFHIHDLSAGIIPYCMGHSLKELLMMGFVGSGGRASSKPAKHLDSALQQISNFMATLQTEAAGAQAFSSWDTYLAPFVRNDGLTYQQVKQAVQQFIFGLNIASRWGQCPFTNLTMDLVPPSDLKDMPVIIGGELQDTTYGEYQTEMDMLNKAFIETMIEGDAEGKIFTFPIPTYNIVKDFDWEGDVAKKLFELTCKFGSPYFANYLNSDMNPSDSRSMCPLTPDTKVIVASKLNGIRIVPIGVVYHGYTNKNTEYFTLTPDGWKKAVPVRMELTDVYKITLSNGVEVKMGENHLQPILTEEGIKSIRAKDLDVDTWIPFNKNGYDTDIGSFNLGYAVGAYIGDGSKNDNGIIYSLSSFEKDDITIEKLTLFWHSIGYETKITKSDRHVRFLRVNGSSYDIIKRFVKGVNALTKDITDDVFKMSFDFRAGLVSGFKATDGSEKRNRLYTSSNDLRHSMQMLFASLGKHCLVNYVDNRDSRLGKNENYRIDFPDRQNYGELFKQDDSFNYYRITRIEKVSGKEKWLYCFEVDNQSQLFYLANGMLTHNCRLRLDLKELRRKNGGLFGSGELTGSSGVCTINMPRIGYLASNKEEFFSKLEYLMVLAKDSLEIKRKIAQANIDNGLLPYTKIYVKSLKNHFSTIGLVGLNEACLNLLGCDLTTPEGQDFGVETLEFMRSKMSEFQEETGNLFNLEGVPAEATAYRLAKIDKEKFGDIITAGTYEVPYYTNSSQIPVGYTDDIFEACDLQDRLQPLYTGGIVQHLYLGERIEDPAQAAKLIKKLCENYKIPYFSLTPTFSICKVHGYIPGNHSECPYDKDDVIEKPAK